MSDSLDLSPTSKDTLSALYSESTTAKIWGVAQRALTKARFQDIEEIVFISNTSKYSAHHHRYIQNIQNPAQQHMSTVNLTSGPLDSSLDVSIYY